MRRRLKAKTFSDTLIVSQHRDNNEFPLLIYIGNHYHVVRVNDSHIRGKRVLELLQDENYDTHFQNADVQSGLLVQPCALDSLLQIMPPTLDQRNPLSWLPGESRHWGDCPKKVWILEFTTEVALCTAWISWFEHSADLKIGPIELWGSIEEPSCEIWHELPMTKVDTIRPTAQRQSGLDKIILN